MGGGGGAFTKLKMTTFTWLWLSLPALDIIELLLKMMILSKLTMKVRNVLSIKT